MTDRKSAKASSYAVGYGRPPKASQFKAGTSGNPNGRPKGSRSVGAVLQDILQRRIAVTENGKTLRIPALEIILRRLANEAMRSDPRAIKLLLALIDRYGESPENALRLGDLLAEDRDILDQYIQGSADLGVKGAPKPEDEESNDDV